MRYLLLTMMLLGCTESEGPRDHGQDGNQLVSDAGVDTTEDALIYCVCPQTGQEIACGHQTAFELKDNLPIDCLDCAIVTDDCHFIDAGPGLKGYRYCPEETP